MEKTRRRVVGWMTGILVVAALVVAPIADAAIVSFRCESGEETFDGHGWCQTCRYTICCWVLDDGSSDCSTSYTCRDCNVVI
jgi:hypothetical protein